MDYQLKGLVVWILVFLELTAPWARGEYIGCYEDAGNRRLLSDYRMDLIDINSPSKCVYICTRLDYRYAGVEYGSQCFCSNQRPIGDNKRSENDCQSSCPHSQEKCGGTWRLAVYSTDHQPDQPTDIAGWASGEYLGCYEDGGNRLLSDYQVDLSNNNSPSKCVYICMRLGYNYAGLENGNQCFCSYQKPSDNKKRSENECQYSCPNSKEKCGGHWRLAVFSVLSNSPSNTGIKYNPEGSANNETYLGCYEDTGKRLFSDFRIELSEINTPRKCIHVCRALGFQYAGVEYGCQCFCSKHKPGEDKKKSETDCQSSCPHSQEKCGGTWRLAAYTYPGYQASHTDISEETVSRAHLGCFEDNGKRLLSDYRINLDDINTPKKCIHVCQQLGYKYAGVENGNECFCGNQKPSEDKKKNENDCRTPCPKSNEKCGGFWRLSAYAIDSPQLDVRRVM